MLENDKIKMSIAHPSLKEPIFLEQLSRTVKLVNLMKGKETEDEAKTKIQPVKCMQRNEVPTVKDANRFVYDLYGEMCPKCEVIYCSKCGQLHLYQRCPARGQRCFKCNEVDHFSYRCKK